MYKLNLEILKKTRQLPKRGDVFVVKINSQQYYYFGRIIKIDVNSGFDLNEGILIYIYNEKSKDKSKIPDNFDKNKLLIPPMMVNRKPWTTGYLETLKNIPLKESDFFQLHCFRDPVRGWLFDEYGNRLEHELDCPTGPYGLSSVLGINTRLSNVFGLPVDY